MNSFVCAGLTVAPRSKLFSGNRVLVADPRIALLFLVPGIGVTLRVNGTAVLSTDDDLRAGFRQTMVASIGPTTSDMLRNHELPSG
mgnify:CR=1 FL=1